MRHFARQQIRQAIKRTRTQEELEVALEKVGAIGSALINFELMSVIGVATFTTELIAEKIVEFSEKKSVPTASMCNTKEPSLQPNDIIHTGKKGQVRRVVRSKSGKFAPNPVRKLKVKTKK